MKEWNWEVFGDLKESKKEVIRRIEVDAIEASEAWIVF